MENDSSYVLITKFLSGDANEQEKETLNAWRRESPENENLFHEYREAWEIITSTESVLPDKELIWDRIVSKIQGTKVVKMHSRSFLIRTAGIAATIALIIGFSFSFFFSSTTSLPVNGFTVKTQSGQRSEVILPDGTHVWLNSKSTVHYGFDVANKERIVYLEGEGYFDVETDKCHPFKVQTKDILVECLGTEFNVKAYDDDDFVSVTLKEGSVRVNSSEMTALLSPDTYLTYDKHTHNMTHALVEADNYTLWRKGEIRYNNEKFADIVKDLSRTFHVNIILESEQLKDKRFTGYIGNSSLKNILDILTIASTMEYRIDNDSIVYIYDKTNNIRKGR